MYCAQCGAEVEQERLQLLKNTRVCSNCARNVSTTKIKGVMVYPHKTGGFIQLVNTDTYNTFKKATNRIGQKSVLRQYSQNVSKAE